LANKCHANHPQTWLLEKPEQIQDFLLDYPVIVKPLAETGGKGVYRVKSFQQLSHYVQDCFQSEDLPILIQENIERYDLDLTILANHGEVICWTIQKRCMEKSGMEFLVDESILNLGKIIVTEINYHGIVDFGVRYDIKRQIPILIESNPRFPASLRFKLWAGVNLPKFGVMMALNQSIPCFNPAVGVCFDYGVSPKYFLLNLFNQNKKRETEYTKIAWKMNIEDFIPHLVNWIISKYPFQKRNLTWYLANDLPQKYT
jgi:predicted ATP-grasp superfamily ATP-dependent carboligase